MLVKIEVYNSSMWTNRASKLALSISRALCYLKDHGHVELNKSSLDGYCELSNLAKLVAEADSFGSGFQPFVTALQNYLNSLPHYQQDGVDSVNAQDQHGHLVAMLDQENMLRFIMGSDLIETAA